MSPLSFLGASRENVAPLLDWDRREVLRFYAGPDLLNHPKVSLWRWLDYPECAEVRGKLSIDDDLFAHCVDTVERVCDLVVNADGAYALPQDLPNDDYLVSVTGTFRWLETHTVEDQFSFGLHIHAEKSK